MPSVAVPLLSGVKATRAGELAQTYPRNLEPVAVDTKLSKGQLRCPGGVVPFTTGPGVDRGGIEWDNVLYRVMGTTFVKVSPDGIITSIGDVGGTGQVTFDFGFDRLGINSGTSLYYYDKQTLQKVTDPDLGMVIDYMWIDGYHMTTDGISIVVAELSDPFQVLPLKYGSAEEDPDMVTGLIKFRGEAYVLGRNTIQVLRNVGGNGFPFQNIDGASIPYGCVGPQAKTLFAESFAFVGSKRNDTLGVYVAGQGTAEKISTREIDRVLEGVADPSSIILEARTGLDEERLYIHLPNTSWVYLLRASQKVQEPVWYEAGSGYADAYRPRNAVICYGKTIVGDTRSNALGLLSPDVSTHYGEAVGWQFDVGLLYNDAKGAVLHSVELVGAAGFAPHGEEPTCFMSMTRDGVVYSVERPVSTGKAGDRDKRVQWRPKTRFRNYMGMRFRGLNKAIPGFSACQIEASPLSA